MASKEFEKEFEEIFGVNYPDYLERQSKGLKIARIPEQYKQRFKEIANTEFSGDYGMLIRELVRTWEGVYVNPNQEILTKIDILADEIAQIKKELLALQNKEEKDANKNYIVKR